MGRPSQNILPPASLYETLISLDVKKLEEDTRSIETAELHASINRLGGISAETGGLYTRIGQTRKNDLYMAIFTAEHLVTMHLNFFVMLASMDMVPMLPLVVGISRLKQSREDCWDNPKDHYNGWMSLARHLPRFAM